MSWFRRSRKESPDEAIAELDPPSPDPRPETDAADDADSPPDAPRRLKPPELADLFLVMEEHLNEVELDDVREIVAELQQPPPLVDRLTRGLDDPEALRDAILSSPTLSADVLRVVNSAAFALVNPISSIEHAVTYLGTTMVKGLVLQSAVTHVMRFETDVQKAAYMRIWRSSYIASAAAQTFAQHLSLDDPTVYATRGLLVNVGDLALISAQPALSTVFAPRTTLLGRIEGQQREVMANTAVLSSMLAREWNLPEDLYTALRYSLTPLTRSPDDNERSPAEQREDVLLYLSCRVGDAVAYGGLRDLADFSATGEESPDLFYLPDYLDRLDMASLLDILRDPKQSRRISRTLSTLNH